jgi:DNA-binding NtrC family response regulator
MAVKILLVDDEELVLRAVTRALRRDGYDILTAGSGPEALKTLAATDVAVIICHHQMQGMRGPEVLAQAGRLRPEAVRIMLTGQADLDAAQAAINQGGGQPLPP